MTEDPVKDGAELYAMDMTVGLSDVEIEKIDALRSDLKLTWKELLDKIQMVFSSLKGPDVDIINSLKLELNLSWSELLKKACLMELMMVIKKE
ncbi:hypothetical protein RSJ42_10205 [Methanosarcina hadiensis]|uniref:hypothetical protein n=1 Tax=Methanosarcina hadiensis TaxID=3078083 RepID=UPI003977A520